MLLLDKEGFLRDLGSWSPAVAEEIAATEGITLQAAHWEVIHLLRHYYQCFEASPANRALVKFAARELGPSGEVVGFETTVYSNILNHSLCGAGTQQQCRCHC